MRPDSTNTLHSCEQHRTLCPCWFVNNLPNGSAHQQFLGDAHPTSLEFRAAGRFIICRGLFPSQRGTWVTGDAPALRHCRAGSTVRNPNYSDSTSRGEVKISLLPADWPGLYPPPPIDLTLIPVSLPGERSSRWPFSRVSNGCSTDGLVHT